MITFSDLSFPLKVAVVLAWIMGGVAILNLLSTISIALI